jgi:hypothetical protein
VLHGCSPKLIIFSRMKPYLESGPQRDSGRMRNRLRAKARYVEIRGVDS